VARYLIVELKIPLLCTGLFLERYPFDISDSWNLLLRQKKLSGVCHGIEFAQLDVPLDDFDEALSQGPVKFQQLMRCEQPLLRRRLLT